MAASDSRIDMVDALQAVLAALRFRAFRYCPLEWLWRAATRTTLAVPCRR